MEHHKISKLLNYLTVSKFVTRKWFKTAMLRSDLCDSSVMYIVVKGTITVEGTNDANKRNRNLTFKNVSFRSCISKINNTFIDNLKELDTVMSMYNLLEYRDNGIFYRDEVLMLPIALDSQKNLD